MNKETLNTICESDWPQKTRNRLQPENDFKDMRNLKSEINNFLWRNLPMKTTLREAEILACKIFALIQDYIEK